MSKKSAREFVARLDKEAKLRDRVRKVTAGLVAVGKEHGHDFTHGELSDALAEKWGVDQGGEKGGSTALTCFSEGPEY